ncbi:MAG: adenylosuccinate synthase [Limnochordia bacterium]|jgi:adenylosuccinate synthase
MPSVVVVGAQWGDEGKGKITDFLAERAQVVVRYQGGSNAGHTVVVNGREFKLHLVPSGVIHPNALCMIGNGVVVDPVLLVEELRSLELEGIGPVRLVISDRAHVILPYHRLLDKLEEEQRAGVGTRIGTTGRGIGPTYVDKVARSGVRMGDLVTMERFRKRLREILPVKNALINALYGHPGFTEDEIIDRCGAAAERLAPMVTDTSLSLHSYLERRARVLFEGAQGTLLDIDHGTYPFVTSSSATAGGAAIGSGVAPRFLDNVLGVVKAYTTRVGEGPFPSELHGELAEHLRMRGTEYGTTTGRPRRVGWFDGVIARYAKRVNGLSALAVMKLDVLSGLDELKLCVAYRHNGKRIEHLPGSVEILQQCEPIYETMPGWQEDISGITKYEDLPKNAQAYLARISEMSGVTIAIISVGPGREQTIVRRPML